MGFGGFLGPSASPSGRFGSFLGLLRAPRGAKWRLKGAQIKRLRHSGCHLNAPRAPKGHPRGPQEHQKGAEECPKTAYRASLNPKPGFFQNRAPAEAKSRFFGVGGTSWKVKIDTRRVQDKKKSISNTSAREATTKNKQK